MTGVLLAVGASLAYAFSAVVGGVTGRAVDSRVAFLFTQAIGVVLLIPFVLSFGGHVEVADIGLGIVAGTLSTVGTVTNLRGLAAGKMAVVNSLFGVMAGCVPVVAGLIRGERPGTIAFIAAGLALAAIVLVAQAHSGVDGAVAGKLSKPNRQGLIAGVCIGLQFVVMSFASSDTGLWVLLTLRIVTVTLLLPMLRGGVPTGLPWRKLFVLSALFCAGDVCFVASTHHGDLLVSGVIVALGPAIVALIAWLVLKQRLNRQQLFGFSAAMASILLFAIASA